MDNLKIKDYWYKRGRTVGLWFGLSIGLIAVFIEMIIVNTILL